MAHSVKPVDIAQVVAEACPGTEVLEVVERTGGQLSTVYEVRTDTDPVIVKV